MYRVLIADDEDIIREGFIEFIPWAELGFEIVYTCENGTQAIEYLKENSVDFILTDIIMAGTTGLDIARYVYENNISSVVCLVSGHRDFEYARQAIKYNVNYYLTKPTDFDDMLEMINEVKKTLDSRKISSEETFALQESFFLDFFTFLTANKIPYHNTSIQTGSVPVIKEAYGIFKKRPQSPSNHNNIKWQINSTSFPAKGNRLHKTPPNIPSPSNIPIQGSTKRFIKTEYNETL